MKSGLVALLTGEATISAIVGARVYINKAPERAALPHIIITQMASEEYTSIDGASGQLRMLTFDIDCKSNRSVEAESLGNAVRTFIDDYSGTAGTYTIGAVFLNGESDSVEPPSDGSDKAVHVVTLDVDIQYSTT